MAFFEGSPRIMLPEGTVIGSVKKLPNGSLCYAYKGIRYAEPPLGELRFEDPIPLLKFPQNILDCRNERDVAHHRDFITSNLVGSEDCLHLNVYSPISSKDVASGNKLAVAVWIHGGAFAFGSGNGEYYCPKYLVQENVIVVTLNYRLGALGFLCLPEAGISGNAGLKDQAVALKWVNKNISKFGGDANNVTLFGGSSGAACVGLHMLSAMSRKHFHKAICQGATSLHEWVIQPDAVGKSKKLAELLGFKGGSQSETLAYLRNITDLNDFHKNLLTVASADEMRRNLAICFKPCIEQKTSKAFISCPPIELLNQPNFINIPVMVGYNSAEGIGAISRKYEMLHLYERDLCRMIPRSLDVRNELPTDRECQKLAEEIRKFYFNGQTITKKLLSEMVRLQGDYHFAIRTHLYAEIHSRKHQNSPLYFYRFAYDGELNFYKNIFAAKVKAFARVKGACHYDETHYLFDSKHVRAERSAMSTSTRISTEMCRMWMNFAKYGCPTPVNDKSISIKWDPVKPTQLNEKFVLDYLEIDEQSRMLTDPDKDRIEFWRNLYQKRNGSFLRPKL